MAIGTIFISNRSQAVTLPMGVRLPEGIHKVDVRARGLDRIISPAGLRWDSFFLDGFAASDDFMKKRARQHQPDRESF